MSLVIRLFQDDDSPLYVQLADNVRSAISEGEYRPGDKLPSVRKLADDLDLNPATVVSAYRILVKEGVAQSRQGSGVYVSEDCALNSVTSTHNGSDAPVPEFSSALLDFAANAPNRELFPLEDVKRFLIEAVDIDGGRAFEYQDATGYQPLRLALADRLSTQRRVGLDADDVHIVSGAQQGLDLVARVLLRNGDCAVVESPGYRGVRDVFLAIGAKVEALPVLEDGMDLDALEAVAKTKPLRLVYVNPSFQNPTGMCWSQEKKQRLATMAAHYGFFVIEDDLCSDLAYDGKPLLPVKSLDRADRIFYVKSFSKSLMPGLRIACLEAPPVFRDRLESAKRAVDLSSNGLMQRVLERFIATSRYDEHAAKLRGYYHSAMLRCTRSLEAYRACGIDWVEPKGGINLWLRLPAQLSGTRIAKLARQKALSLMPEIFFRQEAHPKEDSHLRISFGSVPAAEIARGMEIIGSCIKESI